MRKPVLKVRDLQVRFAAKNQSIEAIHGVSFDLGEKEILGIVGESGAGKSLTSLTVMGLLPSSAAVTRGEILLEGENLYDMGEQERNRIRGRKMSMIFQEPMTALNPLIPVGKQIAEPARHHLGISAREAHRRTLEMMHRVGLPRPDELFYEYPHRLSGGMRQRVVIAMAMICNPRLIIADEPTTALDVTIQAQILDLLREMNRTTGTSILFISHHLGVVYEVCDRVLVMYAGHVVEQARTEELFSRPLHPYTRGLVQSIPSMSMKGKRLYAIPGKVPMPEERKDHGCPFASRCPEVSMICREQYPELRGNREHQTRCHLVDAHGGRHEKTIAEN